MLAAISQNLGTIIVAAIVVALIAIVIISMRSDKKKGKSSCGGSCASCPMGGRCHKDKKSDV